MNKSELESKLILYNFYCGEEIHKYKKLVYTDGVKDFCKYTQSFWLLDIINTFVKENLNKEFSKIRVTIINREKYKAIVFYERIRAIYRKKIEDNDIPLGNWSFYLLDKALHLADERLN